MRTERRAEPRERLYQRADIVFNGRQSIFACSLRNLSETGALLRMTDWIALPATFEIETPGDTGGRRVRPCWRRGDDVGVAFLTAADITPARPIDLAAVRRLRAQAGA